MAISATCRFATRASVRPLAVDSSGSSVRRRKTRTISSLHPPPRKRSLHSARRLSQAESKAFSLSPRSPGGPKPSPTEANPTPKTLALARKARVCALSQTPVGGSGYGWRLSWFAPPGEDLNRRNRLRVSEASSNCRVHGEDRRGSDFEALVFGIWGLGSGVRLFHDYSFLSLGETPWMVEVMVASEIWVFAYDS